MTIYPWRFPSRFHRKPVCLFVRYLLQRGVSASIRQIIVLRIEEGNEIAIFFKRVSRQIQQMKETCTRIVLGTAGSVGAALTLPEPAA